jgi:hypothetical protein
MRTFTERFLAALENQLAEIALNGQSLTEQYKGSVYVCKKAMTKLKNYVSSYAFTSIQEEIHFFKEIKPQFYSKYIYFINLFNFAMQKPIGSDDIQQAYIQMHVSELKMFFDNNRAFYAYCRTGMTELDEIYFTRGGFDVHAELEDFEEDDQYSTSHDYKLSKIMANEKFQEFLNLELIKLNADPAVLLSQIPFKRVNWTASQTDAIELIYSLKAYGAVNNGNIDISELVGIWEYVFQTDLKEVYHKFKDITRRKKVVPVFMQKLAEALVRWINDKFE